MISCDLFVCLSHNIHGSPIKPYIFSGSPAFHIGNTVLKYMVWQSQQCLFEFWPNSLWQYRGRRSANSFTQYTNTVAGSTNTQQCMKISETCCSLYMIYSYQPLIITWWRNNIYYLSKDWITKLIPAKHHEMSFVVLYRCHWHSVSNSNHISNGARPNWERTSQNGTECADRSVCPATETTLCMKVLDNRECNASCWWRKAKVQYMLLKLQTTWALRLKKKFFSSYRI